MFFARLQEICQKNNTTPTAVVTELGISKGSVTSWKNGTSPSLDILQKIADHFNVSTDYLLGRTDNPSPAGEKFALFSDIPYEDLPPEALEELQHLKEYILDKYKKK